jgi:Amt family ammonium transporter
MRANGITWILITLVLIPAVYAGDPSGEGTFTEDVAGAMTSLNFTWVLVAAFLVFFMQVGFAMLGAGILRAKNATNFFTMVFMDFSLGAIAFWAVGFAIMFGGSGLASGLEHGNKIIGYSGFFLRGDAYDVWTSALFLFQIMFAAAAASIVACAVVERLKFKAYMLYTIGVTALIYPVYGHWMWGDGWLASLPFGVGARDFAGSAVVHMIGGLVALSGAYMLGPRIGKYNADGTPNVIPGHNMTYIVIGTFILIFGWFGFNAGSTLAATDLRISVIALNTFLAASAGASSACLIMLYKTGKADITMISNGALGGLVAITGPCAYVAPWASVIIGAVGGAVFIAAFWFIEWKLKVDDPVGAIACHAANGVWGMIALGIFADGSYGGVKGLIVGEAGQLVAQLVAVGAALAWGLGMGLLLFGTLKYTIGIRVSPEEELQGLDITQHGAGSYPEFVATGAKDGR